ncbi:MAG: hypothetical protein ACOYXR_09950 [Nitrospirota bacterium]
MRAILVGALLTGVWHLPAAVNAAEFGADQPVTSLTLIASDDVRAVVRFGHGPQLTIAVGDRVGQTRAEVREIAPGRVVLDDAATETSGRINRAVVVLSEGTPGGTRYTSDPGTVPPKAVKPVVTAPPGTDRGNTSGR